MAIDLPADCDPRLRRLAEYLAAQAPPGKLPGRQHLTPEDIPEILPYITLCDVVPQENGGRRYRVRLAGTHVVELLGTDPTGKFIDEVLPPKMCAEIIKRYDEVVRTKQPSYQTGELKNAGREHVRFERAAFPLARDGENVDMLIFIRVGMDAQGRQFTPPRS